MYWAGKFLQALGLAVLPLALWYGISHEGESVLTKELMGVAVGALLFLVGRRLEARGAG
jgi:hypothetical protein